MLAAWPGSRHAPGSLPRPEALTDQRTIARRQTHAPPRRANRTPSRTRCSAVEAGVSVVNDGEMGKVGYSTYVTQRLSGFRV
jgi:5-methyltetrahydropteroyltriglutamate--homocysteine methyltransferase